jgi:hypothetical protein
MPTHPVGLVPKFRNCYCGQLAGADADWACGVVVWCYLGQMSCTGDPYIAHPVAVATILAGLNEVGKVDDPMPCAAILHESINAPRKQWPAGA